MSSRTGSAIAEPRGSARPAQPTARPQGRFREWLGRTLVAQRSRRFSPLEGLALALIVAISAVFNLIGLGNEGYANEYYAATVKSMLLSWRNFFYVSFDPGGFISVDKPPLGFWLQAASAKIFGFSGWSILFPQALAGILSVALLYYLVRRVWGPLAGLSAAIILAASPISVVTNRNNTIDSLLVLALLGGVWAIARAVESNRHPLRWLLLAAVFVGLGFNIKMLEAYLALPALWLAYLLLARPRPAVRIGHLVLATVVMFAISVSWAVAVDLTPVSQRPFVGSSTDNTVFELIMGHNGLQRLFGRDGDSSDSLSSLLSNTAQSGGGVGGVSENGAKGTLRLLNTQLGGQSGWLIPLAVVGTLAAAWRVRPRRLRFWRSVVSATGAGPLRRRRTSLVIWGTWFVTMAAFFSVAGFFHRYYLTLIAPGIAALAGLGLAVLWTAWQHQGRRNWLGWALPAALLGSAAVQAKLLTDYPTWSNRLTPALLALTVAAAVILLGSRLLRRRLDQCSAWGKRAAQLALAVGIVALLITPAVWSGVSVQAASNGQGASLPAAGPSASGGGMGGVGGMGQAPSGTRPTGTGQTPPSGGEMPTQLNTTSTATNSAATTTSGAATTTQNRGGRGGQIDAQLLGWLIANRGSATYIVAVQSASEASPIILKTGLPVIAYGGFEGSDPTLTADSLAQLVANGTLRYIIIGNRGGGGGDVSTFSVSSWVQAHGTLVQASTWGGASTVQLYDLAASK